MSTKSLSGYAFITDELAVDPDLSTSYSYDCEKETFIKINNPKWSKLDISSSLVRHICQSPDRLNDVVYYDCVCERRILTAEPRVTCTHCHFEYHAACFESLFAKNNRWICHKCKCQMSRIHPPVFQSPNQRYSEPEMLMKTSFRGTIILEQLEDEAKTERMFRALKETTDNFTCARSVMGNNIFLDLVVIGLLQNVSQDPNPREHSLTALLKTPIETLGRILYENQSFFRYILKDDSSPSMEYCVCRIQHFIELIRLCVEDDNELSDKYATERDNILTRLHTIFVIVLVGRFRSVEIKELTNEYKQFSKDDDDEHYRTMLLSYESANKYIGYNKMFYDRLSCGDSDVNAKLHFLRMLTAIVTGLPQDLVPARFEEALNIVKCDVPREYLTAKGRAEQNAIGPGENMDESTEGRAEQEVESPAVGQVECAEQESIPKKHDRTSSPGNTPVKKKVKIDENPENGGKGENVSMYDRSPVKKRQRTDDRSKDGLSTYVTWDTVEQKWCMIDYKPDCHIVETGHKLTFKKVSPCNDPNTSPYDVYAEVGTLSYGAAFPFELVTPSDADKDHRENWRSDSTAFATVISHCELFTPSSVMVSLNGITEDVELTEVAIRMKIGTLRLVNWIIKKLNVTKRHDDNDKNLNLSGLVQDYIDANQNGIYLKFLLNQLQRLHECYVEHHINYFMLRMKGENDVRIAFPIGLYTDEKLIGRNILEEFSILWTRLLVIDQKQNSQLVFAVNSEVLPNFIGRQLDTPELITTCHWHDQQMFASAYERSETRSAKAYISYVNTQMQLQHVEIVSNDMRSTQRDAIEMSDDEAIGGVEDVAYTHSCSCCETQKEFEYNKRNNFVHLPLKGEVPLALLRLDGSSEADRIRKHSPFLFEVADYTQLLGYKHSDTTTDVLNAACGFILYTMIFLSPKRDELHRHLNPTFDCHHDSFPSYVVKTFDLLVDFFGDICYKPPEWWCKKPYTHADQVKHIFGVLRTKECKVELKPLVFLWYKFDNDDARDCLNEVRQMNCSINVPTSESGPLMRKIPNREKKYKDAAAVFNRAKTTAERVSAAIKQYGSRKGDSEFFESKSLEELRKGIHESLMSDVLEGLTAHEDVLRSRNLFEQPTKRLSWMIQQRIKALHHIAMKGLQTCFGGCGLDIRCTPAEQFRYTWSEYMENLFDNGFNEQMRNDRTKKETMEKNLNYGNKICLSCYDEKMRQVNNPQPPKND